MIKNPRTGEQIEFVERRPERLFAGESPVALLAEFPRDIALAPR